MMFTDLFGNAPHARVLEFLMEMDEFDHTISEIARGSDVARPTVYKVVRDLTDQGAVVETRTVGNSRYFQINDDDDRIRRLMTAREPVGEIESEPAGAPRRRSTGRASGRGGSQ